jgi:hypothetical protein
VPVALRQTLAPSFSRLQERYPQRFVWSHKMVIRTPPFQMGQQLLGLLSCRPGAACERCHTMSNSQIHPFNERGVQPPREAQSL